MNRCRVLALGLLLGAGLLVAPGCGSDVESDPASSQGGPGPSGPGGAGGGGSGPGGSSNGGTGPDGFLDCDEIAGGADPEGQPCKTEGEPCAWGWECISGEVECEAGVWKTISFDDGVPECAAQPPVTGAQCDGFCGLPTCPYEVTTPCGSERVVAQCGPIGWSYPVSCDTDCTSYGSADACGADPACLWIGNCDGGVNQCVRNESCEPGGCADGQTCVEMGVNPCDPPALQCDDCGRLVSLCVPE